MDGRKGMIRRYTVFTIRIAVLCALLLSSAYCQSTSERERMLRSVTKSDVDKYQELLVLPEQYTTNGAYYHKKYYDYLIGIARTLSEEQKLAIARNSIGFYFDKRENNREKLHLGLDVNIPADAQNRGLSYEAMGMSALERHLKNIIDVLYAGTAVFGEKEIFGTVVAFRWESGARSESITIWIEKREMRLFEENKLTLKELITRSPITNTAGKLIRLLL